jgi:hypothetical protein
MNPPETPWTWPAGRALVLYHWSWFDPEQGQVITGWSQRNALDEAGYAHLEAEALEAIRSMWVDPEVRHALFIEPHTFTPLTRLPSELRDGDGAPLTWIRALLGEK